MRHRYLTLWCTRGLQKCPMAIFTEAFGLHDYGHLRYGSFSTHSSRMLHCVHKLVANFGRSTLRHLLSTKWHTDRCFFSFLLKLAACQGWKHRSSKKLTKLRRGAERRAVGWRSCVGLRDTFHITHCVMRCCSVQLWTGKHVIKNMFVTCRDKGKSISLVTHRRSLRGGLR